jgi:hypothetical protein
MGYHVSHSLSLRAHHDAVELAGNRGSLEPQLKLW